MLLERKVLIDAKFAQWHFLASEFGVFFRKHTLRLIVGLQTVQPLIHGAARIRTIASAQPTPVLWHR